MNLQGKSLLAGQTGTIGGATFRAVNPATGELLSPDFHEASPAEVDAALQAARESVKLTLNQYRAGVVSYINVITAQATELSTARTSVSLLGSRYVASVQLIQALGGGWHAGRLPDADAVNAGNDASR